MTQDRSYGEILRNERERSGMDLTSLSRRLHIRPDILSAIEHADFDRMPARGYAKNMVRAYARALNLDEQLIADMFLDEVHYFEAGTQRASSASSRQRTRSGYAPEEHVGRSSRQSRASRSESAGRDLGGARLSSGKRSESSRGRRYADDQTSLSLNQKRRSQNRSSRGSRFTNNAQDQERRPSRVAQGFGSVVASFNQGRGKGDMKIPRSFSTIGSTPPYAQNNQQRGKTFSLGGMNMPVMIGIAIVAVLLIIILVVVLNGGKQAQDDVPDIPISGLTDTSSPEDDNQVTETKVAPREAKFVYEVLEGKKAWIEIYQNGSEKPSFAGVVEGPDTQTYDVTGTLKFVTAVPNAVKLTVDNKEVELHKDGNKGQYSYTVDFSEILAAWEEENMDSSSSSSSSAASSSSLSSSSSSSSSSSKSSSSRA